MSLADAILEAAGRVQEAPVPGALLVMQHDGSIAALVGEPGQQLTIGDDGMPAYLTPPAPASDAAVTEPDQSVDVDVNDPETGVQQPAQVETPIVDAIETAVRVGRHAAS
jgi:hypothetical protein